MRDASFCKPGMSMFTTRDGVEHSLLFLISCFSVFYPSFPSLLTFFLYLIMTKVAIPFSLPTFSSKIFENIKLSKEKENENEDRAAKEKVPEKRFSLPVLVPKMVERVKTFKDSRNGKSFEMDPNDATRNEANTFDYIVVGGGTAGLTIATRLAENPAVSVAVVEAGRKWDPFSTLVESIPCADVVFVGTKEKMPIIDWGFKTEPDQASGHQSRGYARGKCLGGR